MKAFNKVVNPIRRKTYNGRGMNVYCKIKYTTDGRLSIFGIEGPLQNGNCLGGCGQIDMHWYDDHENITYNAPWNAQMEHKFLAIWKRWHLNDMNSACEHQRELGWEYKEHHDPKTFKGENCPVCGYSIGSAWLKEEVPEDVLQWLHDLPETTKEPAWV